MRQSKPCNKKAQSRAFGWISCSRQLHSLKSWPWVWLIFCITTTCACAFFQTWETMSIEVLQPTSLPDDGRDFQALQKEVDGMKRAIPFRAHAPSSAVLVSDPGAVCSLSWAFCSSEVTPSLSATAFAAAMGEQDRLLRSSNWGHRMADMDDPNG